MNTLISVASFLDSINLFLVGATFLVGFVALSKKFRLFGILMFPLGFYFFIYLELLCIILCLGADTTLSIISIFTIVGAIISGTIIAFKISSNIGWTIVIWIGWISLIYGYIYWIGAKIAREND